MVFVAQKRLLKKIKMFSAKPDQQCSNRMQKQCRSMARMSRENFQIKK